MAIETHDQPAPQAAPICPCRHSIDRHGSEGCAASPPDRYPRPCECRRRPSEVYAVLRDEWSAAVLARIDSLRKYALVRSTVFNPGDKPLLDDYGKGIVRACDDLGAALAAPNADTRPRSVLNDRDALSAMCKDAFYEARDQGHTMHQAAGDAADKILSSEWLAQRDHDLRSLAEEGRRLASRREDLIARGVDPSDLAIPRHPDGGDGRG